MINNSMVQFRHTGFALPLEQGSSKSFVRGPHKLLHNRSMPDSLHNVLVSGNVTFHQINKFFVAVLFFLIGKISSWAGFGPRAAAVWGPLL